MTAADDPIHDYLSRLVTASAELPADTRADLLDDLHAHLAEVRDRGASEADIRADLDRLGSPEAVVAAAREQQPAGIAASPPATMSGAAGRSRAFDVVTILLLVFGTAVLFALLGVFAVIVWPIAVVLLWTSPSWSSGEKLLATLVWPLGIVLPLMSGLVAVRGVTLPIPVGVPLWIGLTAAPIVVGTVLLRRALQREHAAVPNAHR